MALAYALVECQRLRIALIVFICKAFRVLSLFAACFVSFPGLTSIFRATSSQRKGVLSSASVALLTFRFGHLQTAFRELTTDADEAARKRAVSVVVVAASSTASVLCFARDARIAFTWRDRKVAKHARLTGLRVPARSLSFNAALRPVHWYA